MSALTAEPAAVLVDLCEAIARGDYDKANQLFALTGDGTAPGVARLAEAFGMMLVRVEAREMHLNQVIDQLRESYRQLEEAQAIRVVNERLRREIAERERVERQLRDSQAELEAARARAEDASNAKAAFLAAMSHEIRTPMNGVTTMAAILDRTRLSPEQQAMTGTIRESASALLSVIDDILDFSKIEAGKLTIERVAFDPLELVEGAIDVLAPGAEARGLGLSLQLEALPPARLLGDPGRLRQVLLNLGGNAVKFTETGGVTVRLSATPGSDGGCLLAVEVADTGIGMSRDQLDRLFEAFTQAETSTARRFGGSGLGLAITRRLVELMGGSIDVRSSPGAGSVFRIAIPVEVLESEPMRPDHDLSPATVALTGFPASEAAAIGGLLRLGGVGAVAVVADPAAWPPEDPPDLVVVNSRAGAPALARWSQAIGAAGGGVRLLAAAPHAVVPALAAQRSPAPGVEIQGVVSMPLRTRRLWEHVAVALGAAPDGPAENGIAATAAFDAPPLEEARQQGVAVLAVDDNATNRHVIAMLLSRMGLASVVAESGTAALRLLDEGGFAVVLTDLHMPEMDGFALTRAVRDREAADGRRPVAIVASTADVMPETMRRCSEAGMDGWLGKPLEIDRLEEVLARHVPAAFHLRRPRREDGGAPGEGRRDILDMVRDADPDVFDPAALTDAFGRFDEAASALLLRVVEASSIDIEDVRRAVRSADWPEVRRRTHEASGTLLSVGAVRLARMMRGVEAAAIAGDAGGALLYADCLAESYDELVDALRPLTVTHTAGRAAE